MIFPHSVASGSATTSGAVLWTRVTGWQAGTSMALEVATDAGMTQIVWQEQVDSAQFSIARDYTYKRDLHGLLNPATWYYYRFTYRGEQSPVGRFRTRPAPSYSPQAARVAFVTCNHYQQGYWQGFAKIAQQQPDFVVHLGDFIYDNVEALSLPGRELILPDGVTDGTSYYPASLEDFRYLWRTYRMDSDLQAAMLACAFEIVWDDHEFTNDNYVSGLATVHTGPTHPWKDDLDAMRNLYQWALQAFYEYTPTRPGNQYRSIVWGDLFELMLLDQRSFRSPHPCGPTFRNRKYNAGCPEQFSPDRTMHGQQQMQWLMGRLAGTMALWPIIGSPTMFFDLVAQADNGLRYLNLDSLSGYQYDRQQIVNNLPPNAIVFSGDLHAFMSAAILNESGQVVSEEYMTPAMSSDYYGKEILQAVGLPKSTHEAQLQAVNGGAEVLRAFNGYTNGFLMTTIGRNQTHVELWELDPKQIGGEAVLTWTDLKVRE